MSVRARMYLLIAALACSPAHGQLCDPRPLRVQNFTTTPRSSSPILLGVFGGRAIYAAENAAVGRELWSTDGTAAGTMLIADTTSGVVNSTFKTLCTTSIGLFVGVRNSSNTGSSLWFTDGTSAGSRELIPILNGAGVSGSIVAVGDRGDGGVAVLVDRNGGTVELWCSNGAASGTQMLRTFDCCVADSSHDHFELLGGRMYFGAGDAAMGKEIWSTDGLPGGTTRAETTVLPEPRGYWPTYMRSFGQRLYFAGYSQSTGTATEPFAWTPLIGSYALGILNGASANGSDPWRFLAVGGGASGAPARVVFWADDGAHGRELWSSAGVPGDAAMIADLAPGEDSCFPSAVVNGSQALVGDRVVYAASTSGTGYELFVTDGSPAGTRLLREVVLGAASGVTAAGITSMSAQMAAVETTTSGEWLITDGTDGGTLSLTSLIPGPIVGARRVIGAAGGRLYVSTGNAMYRTDGTAAGTELLATLPSGGSWSNLGEVAVVGSRIVFSALDSNTTGGHGQELWSIDPASQSAALLADINASDNSTFFQGIAAITNTGATGRPPSGMIGARIAPAPSTLALWSVMEDPAQRLSLLAFPPNISQVTPMRSFEFGAGTVIVTTGQFSTGNGYIRSDGTPGGTWSILTVPQQAFAAPPAVATPLDARAGSVIVMSGYSTISGQELWMTPGSPDSGGQLLDIYPGGGSSSPSGFTSLPDRAFFVAFHPSFGSEPWVTDGTIAGTQRLKDIFVGAGSSMPVDGFSLAFNPVALNGRVYFGAYDGTSNRVWSTDGTTLGTTAIVVPGITFTSPPRRFVATSSMVFFEATASATGTELYATDGTGAGTRFLGDITPGGSASVLRELVAGRDRVFFVPQASTLGAELFTSDGTAAGTVITRDISPGGGSSMPTNLTMIGNTCYFTLFTPPNSQSAEIWRSDGTAAETCIVADINPYGSSTPQYLRAVGSRLYFSAYSPVYGTEVWVLSTCAADFNNSGGLSVQDVFDYLGAWFSGAIAADFNASGDLSVQDIFDYLGAWFGGC